MAVRLFICGVIAGIIPSLSTFSFAMMCHGSDRQQITQAVHSEHQEAVVNVGNKVCPVSGEKVDQEGMEAVTYEYEDKIYNFCCASCIDEFKKDPQKYIKKTEEELQAKSQKKTEEEHEMEMVGGISSSEGHNMHEGHYH